MIIEVVHDWGKIESTVKTKSHTGWKNCFLTDGYFVVVVPWWLCINAAKSPNIVLGNLCIFANVCIYFHNSWKICQKTPLSTLYRHPSPSPLLFPRGPKARGKRLLLLPWPLHRNILKSAWSRRNYRYELCLCSLGWNRLELTSWP